MRGFIIGCGLWFLLTVSSALGSPQISIGTHYMLDTDQERQIAIVVSSAGERVEGVYLAVQIGDGGEVNGGTDSAPRIVALDLIGPGTIFNASNLGCEPQYLGSGETNLIALAETATAAGDLEANGVLAYLTVNPHGAAPGSYAISLQNVGANVVNGPWNTELLMTGASIPGGDSIQIVSLHQSIWNAGQNGNWSDETWTSSAPPVPNYTCDAVVDTNYTVDVTAAREANSLSLSNGGQVAISSAGALVLTTDAAIGEGSALQAAGNLTVQDITLNGILSLAGDATAQVGNVSGSGSVSVGDGLGSALLTADSITANALSIGAGSKVVIAAISGGSLSGTASLSTVPEPSTWALLILAALGLGIYHRRSR
jgi:hypothetical protein